MNLMRRLFLAAWPALGILGTAQGADVAMTPDQIKEVVRVEIITIPTPGEFFAAIDKQGRPNWSQLVRTGAPGSSADRAQIALALGTLVADGYIAVEAEDGQGVKNIGKEIINLAKKLNVSQSVLARGNSINDFAANNNWSTLREELEATQNEVKLTMVEQKDSSLVSLVTIGAWLRGTEIASSLVDHGYSPESAQLLHQPAMIDYLLQQIAALPDTIQADPLVVKIRIALEQSRGYVTDKTLTAQNVKDLYKTISAAVAAITTRPTES